MELSPQLQVYVTFKDKLGNFMELIRTHLTREVRVTETGECGQGRGLAVSKLPWGEVIPPKSDDNNAVLVRASFWAGPAGLQCVLLAGNLSPLSLIAVMPDKLENTGLFLYFNLLLMLHAWLLHSREGAFCSSAQSSRCRAVLVLAEASTFLLFASFYFYCRTAVKPFLNQENGLDSQTEKVW